MAEGTSTAFGGDIGEQRWSEAFDRYRQHLAWGGVAIIVLVAGAWFYVRSEAIKASRADAAYRAAMQSVAAGNTRLAASDLAKVSQRYAGTVGGAEAAVTLAKLDYEQGQYQQGLDALRPVADNKGDLQFDARLLRGAGYESLGRWKEAAAAYESAVDASRFDADKSTARAMAARVLEVGGDKASAIKIWSTLADDPKSGFDGEAKLRLGELTAAPAKT